MRALTMLVLVAMGGPASAAPPQPPTLTDARCRAVPIVKAQGFRHKRSKLIAKAGSPNHRGIDVIASEDDPVQYIAGKLAHGKIDKDIQDEDAEVFACQDNGTWISLGVARTNSDGRFAFELEGRRRLPLGMRDMYVASLGDGTGAYFVAYVAQRGTGIVVTDVDGTISWSENSIIKTVVSRRQDIKHRPNAPEALSKVKYPIVYVTARGDVWIDVTRKWLERHGFPRGLLRLSHGAFARPGKAAIEYKTSTLKALPIAIAAGIGNRKSDITAYTAIGLTGQQIFIHLPEYEKEVKKDIADGKAIGFSDYATLPNLLP